MMSVVTAGGNAAAAAMVSVMVAASVTELNHCIHPVKPAFIGYCPAMLRALLSVCVVSRVNTIVIVILLYSVFRVFVVSRYCLGCVEEPSTILL